MAHAESLRRLSEAVRSAIVIDPTRLELVLMALLASGHVLLEDNPGMGKTMLAKAIARLLQASFKRIQCTPDLLPSDITGGAVYNQREQSFQFVAGPLFAHIVLVDEINRASPRTQSSLLEAMAEGQVSSDGFSHSLPRPFFVIATQNPIEMGGTFPLPEAQLDRFFIALDLGYPSFADEVTILEREEHDDPLAKLQPILSVDDVLALQAQVRSVNVARSIKEYIVALAQATRAHPDATLGLSPRAGVALQRGAQALALLRGRTFVTPDDVKAAFPAISTHRILARDRRATSARALLEDTLQRVRIPLE